MIASQFPFLCFLLSPYDNSWNAAQEFAIRIYNSGCINMESVDNPNTGKKGPIDMDLWSTSAVTRDQI